MKRLLLLSLLMSVVMWAGANTGGMRFHDEAADTSRISAMLVEVQKQKLHSPGECVVAFGEMLLGRPYVAHTLEYEPEMVTVNIDELDCTTFVETLIALALTVEERRTSWIDFVYNLRRIRYRGGVVDGYPSRLHYNCDWAVDNTHRGNFRDVTNTFPRFGYIVKSIDFMSANADKYTALADSATLSGIKNVEIGYRSHRFPYIKAVDLGRKEVMAEFREGDILAFTSTIKNLDVTHLGVVKMVDGKPHVMHASSSAGAVVVSDVPLADFVKRNRSFTGVRVFRLP